MESDINVIFEIIKNRNPILSGGFHTNMIAIILDKQKEYLSMVEKDFCRYSKMPSLLVVTMVATITFFVRSSPQQMEYFTFIMKVHHLNKKGIKSVILRLNKHGLLPMIRVRSMSHLFVLVRMTAHIIEINSPLSFRAL